MIVVAAAAAAAAAVAWQRVAAVEEAAKCEEASSNCVEAGEGKCQEAASMASFRCSSRLNDIARCPLRVWTF